MGNEQSVFVVPVTSGLCIEPNRDDNAQPYTRLPDIKNKNQQWVMARQGDKASFKNWSSHDFMCAQGKASSPEIRTQKSPHYWTLEAGAAPGSFCLKSEQGWYLCNEAAKGAAWEEGTKQGLLKEKDPKRIQQMLYYFPNIASLNSSPDALSNPPGQAAAKPGDSDEAAKKASEMIEAKEKELRERQEKVEAGEQDVDEKRDFLQEREKEFEDKRKAFDDRQKAAEEKQTKLEEREKKIAAKEAGSPKGSKKAKDAESQVEQLQSQLAEANKALEEARNQGAAASRSRDAPSSGSGGSESAELKQAREKIASLEAQLRENNNTPREGRAPDGRTTAGFRAGEYLGHSGDPSGDPRWRPDAPLAAGMKPLDQRWKADSPLAAGIRRKGPDVPESDPRWKADSPLAAGIHRPRPAVPENDPRWTAKAPEAAKAKRKEPEGQRTLEPPRLGDGFGHLARLQEAS